MKKVIDFPDRPAVEREAAEWLVRLDSDEPLAAEELRLLQLWMGRSSAHRSELVELARLWNKLNLLTELAVPLGSVRRDRPASRARLRHGFAAVTVLVAVLVSTALLVSGRPPGKTPVNGLYTTTVGEQRTITLPDGSAVMLNTNTRLRVRYSLDFRDVILLQGEAHFTVVPDTTPFRVFAGAGQIRAVGTAFSVYLREDAVSVTVAEGTVVLAHLNPEQTPGQSASAANGGEVTDLGILTAGQEATINSPGSNGAAPAALSNVRQVNQHDMSRRLAWTHGMLLFSGEPLEYAVREIGRYTTMRIRIPDPEVRSIRIGGRFPVGETEQMLQALEKNFGLRITRLSDTEVVVSAGVELHEEG